MSESKEVALLKSVTDYNHKLQEIKAMTADVDKALYNIGKAYHVLYKFKGLISDLDVILSKLDK